MTSSITSIALAFILSLSSLTVVIFRVSPLTSAKFAIPFFFMSILIAVASAVTLILVLIKWLIAHQNLSSGYGGKSRRIVSSSLRQGTFVAVATCFVLLLHLLHIMNWWIAGLVYIIFVLVEVAIGR